MKHRPWSTKKTIIYALVFFIGLGTAFGIQRWYWPKEHIKLGGEDLHVLVARSMYQQHKGLGGRESLRPYDGMLFPFVLLDRQAFVMRDMKFSIDIIWFKNGQVVDIASDIAPEPGVSEYALRRYLPRTDANLVLEVPGGWAKEHGLKIGDYVELVD